MLRIVFLFGAAAIMGVLALSRFLPLGIDPLACVALSGALLILAGECR